MQFTKVHQKLAKPVYEAIPKIAEKAGKKCPKCKGSGLVRTKHYPTGSFNTEATINCLACNGTGKIGWEWIPEAGEFFLCKTEYMDQGKTIQYDRLMLVSLGFRIEKITQPHNEKAGQSLITRHEHTPLGACVPLLHWEKLVRILESMGYTVKLRDEDEFGKDCRYNCGIYIDKLGVGRSAKDFQEAVQKAILALLEQLEEKE